MYLNIKSYDDWVLVRELVDYVVAHWKDIDLSIWCVPPLNSRVNFLNCHSREVRNHMRNFTFSKVMLWVAIDRGLRLADKRSLPCPNRLKWLAARDELYEEVMAKAWNNEGKYFSQTYEDTSALDSCVLIMPLVFFMPAVSDMR
jgi:GH15 family glucan-1,4-alpha-glucosidase